MKKKVTNPADTFTASQVGTLVEEFRGEIRAIAESQRALDDKFTGKFNMLFEKAGHQEERIFAIDVKLSTISKDVADIKILLKGHDKRIERLETTAAK